jgi:thiosulfate dehydrogenase [quinone] large subunit
MNGNREHRDRTLAYTLLRLFLGVNIAMHGISRLAFDPSKFHASIEAQFAHSALPHPLIAGFAVTLPWAEACLGFLLLAGLLTRVALAGGALLMVILTFGSSLVQDWQIAGTQLIYAIAYFLLLFALHYNDWSLDAVLRHWFPHIHERESRATHPEVS